MIQNVKNKNFIPPLLLINNLFKFIINYHLLSKILNLYFFLVRLGKNFWIYGRKSNFYIIHLPYLVKKIT